MTRYSRPSRRAYRSLLAVVTATGLAISPLATPFAVAEPAAATCSPAEASYAVNQGTFDWNVRDSFVKYITGRIARGEATSTGNVATNGEGSATSWTFTAATAEAQGRNALQLSAPGTIRFVGHKEKDSDNWILDTTFSDFRLQLDGTTAALVTTVDSRPFVSEEHAEPVEKHADVTLATWTLQEAPTLTAGEHTFASTGEGVLTEAGRVAFGNIYEAGDPMSAISGSYTVTVTCPTPEPAPEPEPELNPEVTVSDTTLTAEGTHEVTVTGKGFSQKVVGTRPPLAGKPAGVYIVFGRFADTWRPSENAPSSARPGASTLWAVDGDDVAAIGGASRGAVELQDDGSFSVTLTISKEAADKLAESGNYGVYTYAGSGAVNAAFETVTPITFTESPAPTPEEPSNPDDSNPKDDNNDNDDKDNDNKVDDPKDNDSNDKGQKADKGSSKSSENQKSSSDGFGVLLGFLGIAGAISLLGWIITQSPFAAQLPNLPFLPRG